MFPLFSSVSRNIQRYFDGIETSQQFFFRWFYLHEEKLTLDGHFKKSTILLFEFLFSFVSLSRIYSLIIIFSRTSLAYFMQLKTIMTMQTMSVQMISFFFVVSFNCFFFIKSTTFNFVLFHEYSYPLFGRLRCSQCLIFNCHRLMR